MNTFANSEKTDILHRNGHDLSLRYYHEHLHTWSQEHLRHFPWRVSDDPFHILMAEIMLRRTQAKQVVPVYQQFVSQYSEPQKLMVASPDEVARVLYPLGLSWRVPAFQQIAQVLMEKHHGSVPQCYETLLTLPGVGDYVASAVCCFAFKQAIPVIDTNTVRVAGRLFGILTHAESRRREPVRQLLKDLLDYQDPKAYNYALLDLAPTICLPLQPHCEICPLIKQCSTGHARINHVE